MKRDAEPVDAALQDRDSGAPHTDMQSTDPDASRVAPTRRRGRWKRYLWGLLGLLAIVGGLAAFKGAQIAHLLGAIAEMEKAGPMPEAVNSATVERQRWAASIRAVGTIVSEKGVTITNEVSGTVQSLRFDSGQQVQQGQVLVTLDAGIERAELASVTAKRELAEVSSARSRKLVASGAAPRADLDEDTSALKGLSADERALGAQIAKKVVRAPFAGKLGIRLVSPGQYLPAGTEIVVLQSTDALFIDFDLPQRYVAAVKLGLPIEARQREDPSHVARGKITAINPTVSNATRTFRARASLREGQSALRPGMFMNVRVVLPGDRQVVVVPATAVVRAPYGNSVFCVESQKGKKKAAGAPKVARQQFVRLGERRGDFVAITNGLKPGQEVVTAGAFKLQNGVPIAVKNEVDAKAQLSPKLKNR